MNKPHLYIKYFSRDHSLALIELWYKGEYTALREYIPGSQPFGPYLVFHNTGLIVDCYMDPHGMSWIKKQLKQEIDRDPKLVIVILKTFKEKIGSIAPLFKKPKALSLSNLEIFCNEVAEAWVWFEAMWWTIDLFQATRDHSKSLKQLLRLRNNTDAFGPGSDTVIQKSLQKIFPDHKKYSSVILLEEALSKKLPTRKILEQRLQEYFYTDNLLFLGKSKTHLEHTYNLRLEHFALYSKPIILKGQIAFPGKVLGKVHKVINKKQMKRFRKGSILIAPYINVNLIPNIKAAAAMVTDEGGIMSHMAAIAREFKLPSVIGTKIATKIFKDGDMVEVDATNGTVKKL